MAAAAALSETRAANTLSDDSASRTSRNPLARYRTESKSAPAERDNPFVPIPSSQTSPVANTAQGAGTTVITAQAETATFQPPGSKHVDAVVREVMRDTVRIECLMPGGAVEIQLPPTLFPAELMQVGQPVALSIDMEGGYRRPVITARDPSPQPKLPGQEEFERWTDSL
jgi:hypothetical protein